MYYEPQLSNLPLLQRGKVRDIYAIGNDYLLIVASDRISAFDVVLPTPIPQKGQILTTLSNFWFEFTAPWIPNHLTSRPLEEVLSPNSQLTGRAVIVRKLKPLPIEAIVRGYLVGSGWQDYQRTGHLSGIKLPQGLSLAAKLPTPIYTPSSKAKPGQHDENIDFSTTVTLLGETLAEQVRATSLEIYTRACDYAAQRGIIIADTKFEFGLDEAGHLILMDEVLTPDSSRFWPLAHYQEGISPPSFDKQFVRDYLETIAWNKQPPAPPLPPEIVAKTAAKYRSAQQQLMSPT